MKIYVFGYGSLMNPKSLKKTLPGQRKSRNGILLDFQRKINVPYRGFLYLNIVPRAGKKVDGKIIEIKKEELRLLKKREVGYACADVSVSIKNKIDGVVYAFIAPDKSFKNLTIPQTYLDTCLFGKTESEKKLWLEETIIENRIVNDRNNSVYENVSR